MATQDDTNPWKTISSRVAYQSPFLTVREDKVITPGGKPGVYSVVESKPGVLIVAETDNDEIYLIESFRYPLQAWRWELPGGGIDDGDTPLQAAQKELAEELGLSATTWTQLGDMYPSNNGPLNDHNLVFLAQGLQPTQKHHESGEAIRPPRAVPYEEVFGMVRERRANRRAVARRATALQTVARRANKASAVVLDTFGLGSFLAYF